MQETSVQKKSYKISKIFKIYIPLLKFDIGKNARSSNRHQRTELIYKESQNLFKTINFVSRYDQIYIKDAEYDYFRDLTNLLNIKYSHNYLSN